MVRSISVNFVPGFEWESLPKAATIVDVGAGVGSVAMVLAKALPEVNIVVQDRPKVIEEAKKVYVKSSF